jgi:hypothetical protein
MSVQGFLQKIGNSSFTFLYVIVVSVQFISACGTGTEPQYSRVNSEFQREYGARFDVPLVCGGPTPEQALDVVIDSARRLSDFCETQNAGYLRCPVGLCQQEYKPGTVAAPTMTFGINNGTGMSGMFGGFGGSTGGGSTSPGGSGTGTGPFGRLYDSVFGPRLYFSFQFTIPLAKSPDQLTCVNPLNSMVQTAILSEIGKAALAAKNGPCIPPSGK